MVIMYTTHCPMCKVLETKLRAKNIEFVEDDNEDTMAIKGIINVPMLEVGEQLLTFRESLKWVDAQ